MLRCVWGFAGLLMVVGLLGCGGADLPDLGYVEGTVTMDGKPLKNVVLTFQPQNARPSYGRTDENGYYELVYTEGNPGATIGKHMVRISGSDAASGEENYEEDEEGGTGGRAQETIPAKYNMNTELTADVVAGDQVIDFELDSQGEIIQEGNDG